MSASEADAVGLNFYPQSKRYVGDDVPESLLAALPARLVRVGVFVNADLAEIERRLDQASLDLIQLHGDEPLAMVNDLPAGRVIRAVRCRASGAEDVKRLADQLRAQSLDVHSVLVDAFRQDAYGGTGEVVDWDSLSDWREWLGAPLVLAGGLTAENVSQAIRRVAPAAVDTASGVERSVAVKDAAMSADFARRARVALAEFSGTEQDR